MKLNVGPGKLGVIGMSLMIVSFFAFLYSLKIELEFPKNLIALYVFAITGMIFLLLEYYCVEKESIHLQVVFMVVLVFLGVPTYMSYAEYETDHFFDDHEITSCDKDISECTFGISAINPELNYFFCADASEGTGSMENNHMKCEWRRK